MDHHSHSVASLVRGVLNNEIVHVPIGIAHFSMTGNTPQSKIVLELYESNIGHIKFSFFAFTS